jgi:hypothetical protein
MLEPIKIGLGGFLSGFYASLVPTTKAMPEFIARGFDKSFVYAPSGMIDKAEEMLSSWQRNDTDGTATHPAKLPVVIVAVARDYVPSGRDFTRQMADSIDVTIPEDPEGRYFGLRTIAADVRAQIAIFAQDEPTAKAIASQFSLFLDASNSRRFHAQYSFAGFTHDWPVQIETPDNPIINVQTEVKNVVILAADLTLKATIPLFNAPKVGDPNHDDKGTPGSVSDPAGYQVVVEVDRVTPTGTNTDSLGSTNKVIAP